MKNGLLFTVLFLFSSQLMAVDTLSGDIKFYFQDPATHLSSEWDLEPVRSLELENRESFTSACMQEFVDFITHLKLNDVGPRGIWIQPRSFQGEITTQDGAKLPFTEVINFRSSYSATDNVATIQNTASADCRSIYDKAIAKIDRHKVRKNQVLCDQENGSVICGDDQFDARPKAPVTRYKSIRVGDVEHGVDGIGDSKSIRVSQ